MTSAQSYPVINQWPLSLLCPHVIALMDPQTIAWKQVKEFLMVSNEHTIQCKYKDIAQMRDVSLGREVW